MSVRSRLVSVTTTATPLNSSTADVDALTGSAALVFNNGAVIVYVGGADVTTSGATTGLPVGPGDSVPIEGEDEILYGRVAVGTCDMIVLEVGVTT